MSELSITEARDELAEVVNQVQYAGARTYLTRHGRRVAAIVPVSLVEAYEDVEKRADLVAAPEADESDEESLPWERVKAELPQPDPGLVNLQNELIRARSALEAGLGQVFNFTPRQAVCLLGELAATQQKLATTQERVASALGGIGIGTAEENLVYASGTKDDTSALAEAHEH